MPADAERQALRSMLDALDARAPDRVEICAAAPLTGAFFETLARHELHALERALCLAALSERLAGRAQSSGSSLLEIACPNSAQRLQALAQLDESGALLRAGLLIPESLPSHPAEALDTRFRVGEHLFRLACEVFGRPAPEPAERPRGAYRSNAELLGDLRRLSLHYRRRAARLFHLDPWTGAGLDVLEGSASLKERAEREAGRVRERLLASTNTDQLPALALARKHNLELDALVLLTTVLFQELVEGVGAVDAVDLLKLVSERESDLLRRRQMLRPLARKGLLRLEGAYAGKDLTADASLPNEIVAALLGEELPIGSDERLDFHAYLEKLESSESFFQDLDEGDF
ncbi:MAG: hypothetical protein DHS20C15_18370 [Planctomycetota bacterium]|nr:MAG: hypothetical protein DHS20C15_18370 [Planctomycetota bacterium]